METTRCFKLNIDISLDLLIPIPLAYNTERADFSGVMHVVADIDEKNSTKMALPLKNNCIFA